MKAESIGGSRYSKRSKFHHQVAATSDEPLEKPSEIIHQINHFSSSSLPRMQHIPHPSPTSFVKPLDDLTVDASCCFFSAYFPSDNLSNILSSVNEKKLVAAVGKVDVQRQGEASTKKSQSKKHFVTTLVDLNAAAVAANVGGSKQEENIERLPSLNFLLLPQSSHLDNHPLNIQPTNDYLYG